MRQQDLTVLVYVSGTHADSCPDFILPVPCPASVPPIENFSFVIFPNPMSESAVVRIKHAPAGAGINVYNAIGQLVKQIKNISSGETAIYRESLARGVYFVCVVVQKEIFASKKMTLIYEK